MDTYSIELSQTIIDCLYRSGTKVLILSKSFSASRHALENIVKCLIDLKAEDLFKCQKKSDAWNITFNNKSVITAIPFMPDRLLCGYRANILILVNSDQFTAEDYTQLLPFITVNSRENNFSNKIIKL